MEVDSSAPKPSDKTTPQIRDYWRMYHRSTVILTIGMQLLVAIVVGGALLVGGATVDSLLFWLVLSARAVMDTMVS